MIYAGTDARLYVGGVDIGQVGHVEIVWSAHTTTEPIAPGRYKAEATLSLRLTRIHRRALHRLGLVSAGRRAARKRHRKGLKRRGVL